MGLTPEEIAHRAFTPSVDGYHQGEVRSFLERIASELRGLQTALPDGRVELAELTAAIHDHEPRLSELENRLTSMVVDLTAATNQMKHAQRETAEQLEAARAIAADQRATVDAITTQRSVADSVTSEQRSVLEQLNSEHAEQRRVLEQINAEYRSAQDQVAAMARLAEQQREAAEHLVTVGERTSEQLSAAQDLAAKQGEAAAQLASAGDKAVAQLATAKSLTAQAADAAQQLQATTAATASASPRSRPASVYTDPIDGAPLEAPTAQAPPSTSTRVAQPEVPPTATASPPAPTPASGAPSLFGADLDDQPLFSDSANDLLDGVLDDVMGNLTDEGNPS